MLNHSPLEIEENRIPGDEQAGMVEPNLVWRLKSKPKANYKSNVPFQTLSLTEIFSSVQEMGSYSLYETGEQAFVSEEPCSFMGSDERQR